MKVTEYYNLKAIGNKHYYYFYDNVGKCLGKLDFDKESTLYEIRMINSINCNHNKVFSTQRKDIIKLSAYILMRKLRERKRDSLF